MNYSNTIFDVILALCGVFWLINAKWENKCLSIFMGVGLLSIVASDIVLSCLGKF